MKPKIKFWNNYWWCKYLYFTGQGNTPKQAFNDMIGLMKEHKQEMEAWRMSYFKREPLARG